MVNAMANLPEPLIEGLTEKQVAFAVEFVARGGRNATAAGVAAGYSVAGDGHRAVVSRLLRHPRVLKLIRHLVLTDLQADAVASMDTLKLLRDDPSCPQAVRRQAANDILAQAGYLVEKFATIRHEIHDDRRSDATDLVELVNIVLGLDCGVGVVDHEKWERAQEKARAHDARRAPQPVIIDVSPTAVEPNAAGGTIATLDGLEDLI